MKKIWVVAIVILVSIGLIVAVSGWLAQKSPAPTPPGLNSPTALNATATATPISTNTPVALTPTISASPSPKITPASSPPITTALPASASIKNLHGVAGLNAWLFEQDSAPVVEWLKDLKVDWVRHQLPWNEIEPKRGEYDWQRLDKMVEALRQANVQILLNPVHSPGWACGCVLGMPTDPQDFANFMGQVARRYKGRVAAYEIWNEANLAQEAGKPISAARYVELLKAGYKAIKEADPEALVVFGGLSATGINDPSFAIDDVQYLKQVYAYQGGMVKNYFDILGVHPGSTLNPPETLWPDNPGPGPGWQNHPSFYFRRIEQIRQVMVEAGDEQKKVWLTELGWASTSQSAPGFEFAAQVSEKQQALYIGNALKMGLNNYPWMGLMFVFQLNLGLPSVARDPNDERVAWGLLRRDGSKRPAYFALRDFTSSKNP